LRSGWFVLKLPSSADIQQGIAPADARLAADVFFRNSDLWRNYARTNSNRIGTTNLTEYLAQRLSDQLRQEYVHYISRRAVKLANVTTLPFSYARRLPRIRQSVKQALLQILQDIASLPSPLKTDPIAEIFGRVTKLTNEVREYVMGNSPLQVDRRGLVQKLLALYGDFKDAIRATVPAFDARKPSPEMVRGSTFAQDVDLNDLDADGENRTTTTRGAIRIEEVMKTAREWVIVKR